MIDFMTRDIYLEAASPASLEMAICLEIVLWSGVAIPGPVGQYSVQGWPHLPPVSRVTPEVRGKLFIPTLASLFVEIKKGILFHCPVEKYFSSFVFSNCFLIG